MKAFILFELFLVLFALYAIAHYEGGMQAVVPFLCLVIAFLFERVRRRRRFYRYSTKLKAQYSLKENNWNKCTVNTIARKGMGIVFNAEEIIIKGKPPALPGDSQSLTFPGVLYPPAPR